MKKSLVRMISLLIALFGMCFAVRDAGALDAPHNTNDKTWSITCSLCHYNPSSTPGWATYPTATDNTFVNNLCKSCHVNAGKMAASAPEYQDALTHSSYLTSTQYGVWTHDCSICHNPHYQQQATIYGTDPMNYVVTGTISALSTAPGATVTSLADNTKDFISAAVTFGLSDPYYFSGYLLIPNIAYPNRIYRITSTATNTLTVDGAINLNYAAVGSTYAIRYSKMIKNQIMTPFGLKPVRVFNDQGVVSLGTGTMSVCQVCHTQTASYKSDGFASSASHTGDDDMLPGGKCGKCHEHKTGFKPPVAGCNDCHGNPPKLNTVGPDGLVGFGPNNDIYPITGATRTNPGAHLRHASTIGMRCEACHKGSQAVMPSLIDKKIRMGFDVNPGNFAGWGGTSVATGSITVMPNANLLNGYTWLATTAGTQLITSSPTYTPVCSAVYCHGGGVSGSVVSLVGGTNRTPSWMGGPSQAACGTCHGVTKATYTTPGSHNRHVNTGTEQMGVACADCHGTIGTSHINGNANWNQSGRAAGTYRGFVSGGTGTLSPSSSYGQCSNMYCHSSVQSGLTGNGGPSSYDTPLWGAASVQCDSCHGQGSGGAQNGEPLTGNHDKHLNAYTQIICSACHTNGGDNTAQHADGLIQTGINTTWGASATYSQGTASTPQNGFGSCSATYCHSQGTSATAPLASNMTATWGNVLDCTGCHNFNASVVSFMTTSAHSQHIKDSPLNNKVGRNILCSECHRSTVASGDSPVTTATNHVNKLLNIKFDNSINRDNDNPLYNGLTTTLATGATKTAGLTGYTCSNLYCHSIGNLSSTLPATNTLVTAGGVSYRAISWTGAGIGCDGCHGGSTIAYPNYGPGSAGTITANSHAKHVSSYSYGCDYCHVSTTDDPNPAPTYVLNTGTHLNRIEDVSFKLVNGLTGTYISTNKSCSNTYCHGVGNLPVWGQNGPLGCTACHGNPPADTAHLLHVTAGTGTAYGVSTNLSSPVAYNFLCGNCHPGNASFHYNGQVDISMAATDAGAAGTLKAMNSDTASRTGTGLNTVCLNIYCHSNGLQKNVPNSNILTTAASPSWGATPTGNKCANCHGNPPTYASAGAGVPGANSHYNATGFMGQEGGHLVGQHFDNIFSGTTGTLSPGGVGNGNASHGNPTIATTISCLTCHNTVVSSTTIDTYAMYNTPGSSMNCSACHTGATPTKLQAGAIANKNLHVNGASNVAFITPMLSKAQLVNTPTPTWTRNPTAGSYKVAGAYDSATLNASDWVPATRTCVTACHNSEPVTWGDPNVTCYSCHKGL